MSRRRGIWTAVAAVAAVVLVVGAVLFQPWLLFIDDEVDEADDPGVVVATASDGLADTASPVVPEATGDAPTRVELASGEFIDAEHGTSGTVTVSRRSDGTRFLRIEDLDTSNGPDLHVWLTDQPSGGGCDGCFDSWATYDDGAHVALGELKGNQGSQNYEIPADVDLAGLQSVVIWCDRFNVAFGTAAIA